MNSLIEKVNLSINELPITHCWRGEGSAIFLEIGNLNHEKRKNHPKGEFSVMLDCEWRVESKTEIVCGSFCDYETIEEILSRLVGDAISHIETLGTLHEILIVLKSGLKVASFSNDIGNPEWCLFMPNKKVLNSKNGVIVSEDA